MPSESVLANVAMMQFSRTSANTLFMGVVLVALTFRVLASAWVSDDAYITFRVIDNFLNGYGLTWNTDERVQAYTHPLWMLLNIVPYWIIGNIYISSLLVSFLCFAAAIWFALRTSSLTRVQTAIFFLLPVALSRPIVEYATSGLENPLGMLLIAWFFHTLLKAQESNKTLHKLAFISALLLLTRMDFALLIAPIWLYLLANAFSLTKCLRIGFHMWPLWVWCLFSLFYYGFVFPNTKYAKLGGDIPSIELFKQGIYYLYDLMLRDTLSFFVLLFIPFSTMISFLIVPKQRTYPDRMKAVLMVTGVFIYTLYVIRIGGDFMGGRFWAVPIFTCLLVALQLVPQSYYANKRTLYRLALVMIATAALAHWNFITKWEEGCKRIGMPVDTSDADKEICSIRGIIDEARFYHRMTGLIMLKTLNVRTMPEGVPVLRGEEYRTSLNDKAATTKMAGMPGFYAGPQVILVDIFALTDPLLARLPAIKDKWRIGHFERNIPDGYMEARVQHNPDVIKDPDLAQYYAQLRIITSGNLWDSERLKTIIRFNLGKYNGLLAAYKQRQGS